MNIHLRHMLFNWRRLLVLPLVPVAAALCVVHWCFRKAVAALDTAEEMSGDIFNWSRKGIKP